MISKEILEELIKQEETILSITIFSRQLYKIKLNKNMKVENDKLFLGCKLIRHIDYLFQNESDYKKEI